MSNSSYRSLSLVLIMILAGLSVSAQSIPADLYVGNWKGEMLLGRAVPLDVSFERAGVKLTGALLDPSGKKVALAEVMAAQSGVVFKVDRGEGSFMIFTGQLSADKASLSGNVTILEGRVERGKATWKAQKVGAGPATQPTATPARPLLAQQSYDRGVQLARTRAFNAAVAAFTECLKVSPKDAACLFFRGFSNNGAWKSKEALADLDLAISLTPKPPSHYYIARAEARNGIEDHEGAIADSDIAFGINGTPDAHLTRGLALLQTGTALHFDALIRGKKDQQDAGRTISAKGLDEFNKFIQLRPQDHRGYLSRGFYYYQLLNVYSDDSRLNDALADYNKALTLSPQNAQIFYNRGLLYQLAGQKALADADMAKYNELSKR